MKIYDDELVSMPISSQMRVLAGGIAANVLMILGAVAALLAGNQRQ